VSARALSGRTETVVTGAAPASLRRAAAELWAYRGTVAAFAERNVRVRYKQTVLGALWVVVQPLAFMVVFTVALGRLADVPSAGTTYEAFSLSAFVAWSFVQNAVSQGANALVIDAAFLRKVYFPREVPVIAAQLSASVDFAIGLALFYVLGPVLGAEVSLTWLLAPVLFAGLLLLASGASLLLAGLNVYYRDFRNALPFLLQLGLFASPVAYPITVVPEEWRTVYATLNPAAGLLDSFRRVLTVGELPDPALLGPSLAGTLVVAYVGLRVFRRLEPNFADVV
jgi:lipopolysaccharide transport system permease protein